MQIRHRNPFSTVRTEGAILPPDILERIQGGDRELGGLTPESYHLVSGEKLNEAASRSWNRMQVAWDSFKEKIETLPGNDPGTTQTRERFLLPLFQELGYGRLQTSRAIDIDEKSYPISHAWGNVPIHLVGCRVELDRRTPGVAGAARTNPHSMVQEFLNRSDDHLWALLSNGLRLQILRDNASLTRKAFVEFDLEGMFEGEVYSDFLLLWLLCHQSRLEAERPEEFWLEKWSQAAQEQGARALDKLRDGVEEAITALGMGFLKHPANQELRSKLHSGELTTSDYYRQLLRLVYRLIFLFVVEDRELLHHPEVDADARQRYTNFYSTTRIRRLAEHRRGTKHHDLFISLRLVMVKLDEPQGCPELGLPALGGFLFSRDSVHDLVDCQIANQYLLESVRKLAFTQDGRALRPVDYKNLGPEELGSVYEALLELHPEINLDAGTFALATASGHERKTTGSYYTPSSLIQVLLDSALDPVIEDRLGAVKKEPIEVKEKALLDIKVCDPASGSGHFLIAAAHRLAKRLASIRSGEEEPTPEALRSALRDVISRCIYGVDINPMAVELCKVGLWMEALEPGKPLSFLDSHIRCGNSLVGVGPGMDISEIPDDAFQPAFGDDRSTATALRRRNKREREGQLGFRFKVTDLRTQEDIEHWAKRELQQLENQPEEEFTQVQNKAKEYLKFIESEDYRKGRLEYDLWTAAFFWPIPEADAESMLAPTQQELLQLRSGDSLDSELVRRVNNIAENNYFFHWVYEFPLIFSGEQSGFDVVLGNPPWERIQPEAIKFFRVRKPELLEFKRTDRLKEINKLSKSDPALFEEWNEERNSILRITKYLKLSSQFPLSTKKNVNSYAVFLELTLKLLSSTGISGLVIQSGIATDAINQNLFSYIVRNRCLVSLYDFDNRKAIFPSIHRMFKFCLITCSAKSNLQKPEYAFFLQSINDLKDEERKFSLSEDDFRLISPNTGLCPTFRYKVDASLVLKIYTKSGVFIEDNQNNGNKWGASIKRIFSTSYDGEWFIKYSSHNFDLKNHFFVYEAKLFHQFDHRYATYEGNEVREFPYLEKGPNSSITALRLIKNNEVNRRLELQNWSKNYLLAYRDITNATNIRTCIASILPKCATDDTIRVIFIGFGTANEHALLLANLNSLVLDYSARNTVPSTHLSEYLAKQLPILSPDFYDNRDYKFIIPRVVELVYTDWDLLSFAAEIGIKHQPFRWEEDRRFSLRAELDAYYTRLYGLNRDELKYILDPEELYGTDFSGETFRVLKEKEIREYGEYRTQRLVLKAWDRMQEAIDNDTEYVPMVDPPPADPRVAHAFRKD